MLSLTVWNTGTPELERSITHSFKVSKFQHSNIPYCFRTTIENWTIGLYAISLSSPLSVRARKTWLFFLSRKRERDCVFAVFLPPLPRREFWTMIPVYSTPSDYSRMAAIPVCTRYFYSKTTGGEDTVIPLLIFWKNLVGLVITFVLFHLTLGGVGGLGEQTKKRPPLELTYHTKSLLA